MQGGGIYTTYDAIIGTPGIIDIVGKDDEILKLPTKYKWLTHIRAVKPDDHVTAKGIYDLEGGIEPIFTEKNEKMKKELSAISFGDKSAYMITDRTYRVLCKKWPGRKGSHFPGLYNAIASWKLPKRGPLSLQPSKEQIPKFNDRTKIPWQYENPTESTQQ